MRLPTLLLLWPLLASSYPALSRAVQPGSALPRASVVAQAPAAEEAGALLADGLTVEHLADPEGLGQAVPRFGWRLLQVDLGARALSQSAFRLQVASSPEALTVGQADLWDSGKLLDRRTIDVPYAGQPLISNQRAIWRVMVWDQAGRASPWSAPARFSMGLLSPEDWSAEWIGWDDLPQLDGPEERWAGAQWLAFPGGKQETQAQTCLFSRDFELPAAALEARLLLTADDQWQVRLDGGVLASSDGREGAWQRPVELDLTGKLAAGRHRFEIEARNHALGSAALLARLRVVLPEGKTWTLVSDGAWSVQAEAPGAALEAAVPLGGLGIPPWGRFEAGLRLPPTRLLRHAFELEQAPRRASLHWTALGLAEVAINGARVGDAHLVPGWTDFTKRVLCRSIDVTHLLSVGPNAIGVELADGWYSGYVGYGGGRDHYAKSPRLCLELHLEFEGGTQRVIRSDGNWRASTGPRLEADLLMGELYDARLELPGWSAAGFDDSRWAKAETGAPLAPLRQPHPGPPVRTVAALKPVASWQLGPGCFAFDLGQNIAGVARLTVKAEPGQRFVLRFAERLNPDRTLYTANLRGARAIDTYVARGGALETFEPRFTFHGFQYVEVCGLDPALTAPPAGLITGIALTSDTPYVSSLSSSEPGLERLMENIRWTQRMNFIDIPTDCPQRDERLGWTGDALIYARTAAYNADVRAFFDKWLQDLADAQRADGQFPMVAPLKVAGDDGGPAWSDAGAIIPWELYQFYGDRSLLERQYPSMRRFLEFCIQRSGPELLPPKEFHCFGDWVNLDAETPKEVIYLAYLARSTACLAQAAAVLQGERNRPELAAPDSDAARYLELWQRLKQNFNRDYVSADGRVRGETQCGYALALAFDLLDEPRRSAAARHLADAIEARRGHFSTGFVGTRVLLEALTKTGQRNLAATLVLQRDYPSWLFAVDQGATSIWERWDGWTPERGFQDPGMNSFAHYSFGCVGEWLFESGAGLAWGAGLSEQVGRLNLRPRPIPGLARLGAEFNSPLGRTACGWRRLESDPRALELELVIPPNLSGYLWVPSAWTIAEGSTPLEQLPGLRSLATLPDPQSPSEPPARRFELPSGSYRLRVQLPG